VNERLRAPLAAAVALLIGGDLAAYGPAALLDLWRWLFPYLWLFLLLEALRRRRRLGDDEVFCLGAAVGLVSGGILNKTLQDGLFFLGINWLGAALAAFDWGLLAVVSLHALDAFRARPEPEGEEGTPNAELVALVFLPAAALAVYLAECWTGSLRYQRMLGSSWLLADCLFAAAAYGLARRALIRSEAGEPPPRDRFLWALAALAGWVPGAQLAARLGGQWPSPFSVMCLLAWTAGFGSWFYGLWRHRGRFDPEPRRADRSVLGLAGWRLAGAVLLLLIFGPALEDGRSAAGFTFLVDLPVRLLFLAAFFRGRLGV
jgi:hypothetical protein